jgi:hypothetical protein
VLALAAGVGIYFLFTVLWQQLPYLAVLLAPVAVAGLVGGVARGGSVRTGSRSARGWWRSWSSPGPC